MKLHELKESPRPVCDPCTKPTADSKPWNQGTLFSQYGEPKLVSQRSEPKLLGPSHIIPRDGVTTRVVEDTVAGQTVYKMEYPDGHLGAVED